MIETHTKYSNECNKFWRTAPNFGGIRVRQSFMSPQNWGLAQGGFIVGEGNLKARSFVECLTNSGHYRLNRNYCSNEIIRVSVRLAARVAVFYDDNETTLPQNWGLGGLMCSNDSLIRY